MNATLRLLGLRPLSGLDLISPEDAELILIAFKRLSPNQWTSISDFWDSHYRAFEREWKDTHDQARVEWAYRILSNLGYARQGSPTQYSLSETKITPDIVLRRLLDRIYDQTKNLAGKLRVLELLWRGFFWSAIFLAAVFVLILVPLSALAIQYSQLAAATFLVLFFCAILTEGRSSRLRKRLQISNEKRVAVALVDAYDRFVKDEIADAAAITQGISQILRRPESSTRWSAIDEERAKLSQIGEAIVEGVVPAIKDKKHRKKDVGEILLRLACVFFEGTSASISRAPTVYESLNVHPTPVVPKITIRGALTGPTAYRLGWAAVSALALPLIVFGVIARIVDKTLIDFVPWIGSGFIVTFIGVFFGLTRIPAKTAGER
jgi:hypothetical protein